MIISNELLSHVFRDDQQDFKVIGLCSEDRRLLDYFWVQELPDHWSSDIRKVKMSVNIYELAHKCKEWAFEDKTLCGYSVELKSYKSENGYWLCELMSEDIIFSADTEPEAIFKAAQWLFENKRIEK